MLRFGCPIADIVRFTNSYPTLIICEADTFVMQTLKIYIDADHNILYTFIRQIE